MVLLYFVSHIKHFFVNLVYLSAEALNKLQTIKVHLMTSVSSYMFRHRNAILRESTWTKEHKCNTIIQVLIALLLSLKY